MLNNTLINAIKTYIERRVKSSRSNWNQNDPTADEYIKNRPFYTSDRKYVDVISNFTSDYPDENGWFGNVEHLKPFDLSRGETYTVIWDGAEYECVAVDDGYGGEALGNFAVVGEGNDTGEPFFLYEEYDPECDERYCGIMSATEGVHTVTVSGFVPGEIHKIPSEYLPFSAPDWNADKGDGGYIANKPFDGKFTKTYELYYDTITTAKSDYGDAIEKQLSGLSLSSDTLKEGNTYLVVFDGIEYICKAQRGTDGGSWIAVGNMYLRCKPYPSEGFINGEPYEAYDEPFAFQYWYGWRLTTREAGAHTFELYEVKINEDVIPNTIARVSDIPEIDLTGYATDTYVDDKTSFVKLNTKTYTFDGDTEGLETIDKGNSLMYKISDDIPDISSIKRCEQTRGNGLVNEGMWVNSDGTALCGQASTVFIISTTGEVSVKCDDGVTRIYTVNSPGVYVSWWESLTVYQIQKVVIDFEERVSFNDKIVELNDRIAALEATPNAEGVGF